MKEEKIYESMSDIDEKFITEARTKTAKKKQSVWLKWTAAAACLCLVIAMTATIIPSMMNGGFSTAKDPFHAIDEENPDTKDTMGEKSQSDSIDEKSHNDTTEEEPQKEPASEKGQPTADGDFPATIMVNGVNHYSTNKAILAEIDESAVKYTTSYAENGVPEKDGEDNFNSSTGTPYAVLEDGVVAVLIGNEWIEFKAK